MPSLFIHGSPVASAKWSEIAGRVDSGSVFVYPTETIYGIGGVIDVPGVREKIFRAKKRGPAAQLIIIAAHRKFFMGIPLIFPPAAEALARAFWPGKVTLILPATDEPEGIAVRISDHPFITTLFHYCTSPIYSTSANMSGAPYCNDPDLIYSQFADAVDFMVDAGPLPESVPSTIVRVLENNKVTVIREGIIPGERILAVSVQ